jgi:hypothetical protein
VINRCRICATREIALPPGADPTHVASIIEQAINEAALTITLRDSLHHHPASIHWHVQRPPDRGTLEITFWPRQRQHWINVARNLQAAWIGRAIPRLTGAIEAGVSQQ